MLSIAPKILTASPDLSISSTTSKIIFPLPAFIKLVKSLSLSTRLAFMITSDVVAFPFILRVLSLCDASRVKTFPEPKVT